MRGVEGPDDVLDSMCTASASGEGGGASLPVTGEEGGSATPLGVRLPSPNSVTPPSCEVSIPLRVTTMYCSSNLRSRRKKLFFVFFYSLYPLPSFFRECTPWRLCAHTKVAFSHLTLRSPTASVRPLSMRGRLKLWGDWTSPSFLGYLSLFKKHRLVFP